MLRNVVERSSHRMVFKRRLPSPFERARIYASTEGGLRYLRPRIDGVDRALLRLAAEEVRSGDVVWDIGANLGLFSFAAAISAGPPGHVVAVEPDTHLVGLLRRSATANPGHADVDIFCAAVADQVGVGRFHIARRNRSTSHLDGFGTTEAGGTRQIHLVPTVTLDWLADKFLPPDIIKIDVEEAELTVLDGGHRLLGRGPTIMCEVASHNARTVGDLLGHYGYTLYDGDLPRDRRIPMAKAAPNTLAIRAADR